MHKKAVFLDRDGVINDNSKHVNQPEDLVLYDWTTSSIRQLNEAGFLVFVVTNQGGIEMGYFTEDDLHAIHAHLELLVKNDGAVIEEITYCPHFHYKCECRKPKPGMILRLAKKHDVDLQSSWMVGDFDTDIEAGICAGCKSIKIGEPNKSAEYSCLNLEEAVGYILNNS